MPALGEAYLGETYLGGPALLSEGPAYPTGLTLEVDSAIGEYVAKQGDSGPAWTDQLTWSDGKPVNLTGCTVEFTLRRLSSSAAVSLTGSVAVPDAYMGSVLYSPSAADTAFAGEYMACWVIRFPSGEVRTAPTEGYREVRIEPNLASELQQLVSLTEVKMHLRLPANDHTHDAELVGLIEDVQPLIEEHTGPIIPKVYDEWYEGGHSTISLRHKPSFGFGTTPLLRVMAVSEYRGPIEYNIAIVSTPTQGSVYSEMTHDELGLIVRRTAGGGTYSWWQDPSHPQQSVHVIYEAGQEVVPRNVARAAREAIRWWWTTTMATGRGRETAADAEQQLPHVALPYHVVAMLSPTRRHPSLA
jgi:hypothetical protein